ncbi:MAG: response regulator [Bacillota bacterium]
MATILVVEDHAMSREILSTLLGSVGHVVKEATEAMEALALARETHPQLIVCDVLLPTIDGIEFVRRLRREEQFADTPVIFYTAAFRHPEGLDVEETCQPYRLLTKPSDPRLILNTVDDMLSNGRWSHAPIQLTEQARQFLSLPHNSGLQLPVLLDLSLSLISQRDPRRLLQIVVRALRAMLNCRHAQLCILDPDGAGSGYSQERIKYAVADGDNWVPPTWILDQVMSDVAPFRGQADAVDTPDQPWPPCRSLLVVPFDTASRVYGWICLADKRGSKGFSEIDQEIAETVGREAALGYENILLVEELKRNEEHLEKLVATRTAELARANQELHRAQKLESLGVLAGGIAHDFNNNLTVILNLIQIARLKSDPVSPVHRYLGQAEKACHEAKALTEQLLTFARGGSPMLKPVHLPDLLPDAVNFALRGSNSVSQFILPPDLWPVEADQGQIGQVIHNLVTNAWQAMPDGGLIHVLANNIILEEDSPLNLSPGRYVKISVIDEGVGIPAENLNKVFDPYFTTRDTGNGLGLATAYSIVQKHEGRLTVESRLGGGTAFHIYLPATSKQPSPSESAADVPLTTGRILLVDDQEAIAASLAELLQHHGYATDVALDGTQGIRLYQNALESDQPYDAVITDLTIPGGMGGKEMIRRLIKLCPTVKAIVASGYSNDPVLAQPEEYGFCGAIAKPYRIEDVMAELSRVISSENAGRAQNWSCEQSQATAAE